MGSVSVPGLFLLSCQLTVGMFGLSMLLPQLNEMSEVVDDIAEHRKQIERIEEILTPKKQKQRPTPTTPSRSRPTPTPPRPPPIAAVDKYEFCSENEDENMDDISMHSSPLSSKVGSPPHWPCQERATRASSTPSSYSRFVCVLLLVCHHMCTPPTCHHVSTVTEVSL